MPFIIHEQIDVAPGSDFLVTAHGSLTLLQPLTHKAEEWVGDNIALEGDTQFWGRALVIEHRYVADILAGIAGDGLCVSNHHRTIN